MAKTKIALVALLAACGSISLVGCSNADHSDHSGSEAQDLQEVGFNLRTNGGELSSVSYRVLSSSNAVVDQGIFQTPETTDKFRAQLFLRIATGYTIELSGSAVVDGSPAPCSGSQTFNVVAGVTTQVAVALTCTAPAGTTKPPVSAASVEATLQINRTPSGECGVTQATVGPQTQLVGSNVTLTSALVGTGAAGTWSATGLVGSFGSSTAAATTFTCQGVSAGSITLSVTGANGCTDSVSAAVNCVAVPGTICGNGAVETGETCDDGNTTAGDGCSATCIVEPPVPVVCGNGIIQVGEICDDGNQINNDSCMNNCQGPFTAPVIVCGNGAVETGETCDDSNTVSGDGCSATCQTEVPVIVCGNGIVQAGEACDDGNQVDTDACKNDCTLPVIVTPIVCGDGVIAGTEQCDSANRADCSSTCKDGRDCTACLETDDVVGSYQTSLCKNDPLCLAVESCISTSGCFLTGDANACFCGTAPGDCYAASYVANGTCKAKMIAATGLTNPTNDAVLNVLFDPSAGSIYSAFLVASNPSGCKTECKLQ